MSTVLVIRYFVSCLECGYFDEFTQDADLGDYEAWKKTGELHLLNVQRDGQCRGKYVQLTKRVMGEWVELQPVPQTEPQ